MDYIDFIKDTGLRCAWTFAEAMLGCLAVGQTMTEIAWSHAFSISGVAVIICLFKQIAKYARNYTGEEDYYDEVEYEDEGGEDDE